MAGAFARGGGGILSHRSQVLAVCLLAAFPLAAGAQGPAPVQWPHADPPAIGPQAPAGEANLRARYLGVRPLTLQIVADSSRIPRTYWKAGAVIGGGAMGVLGAAAFVSLCGYDEGPCHNPLLWGAGGFALFGIVGFGVGALIGGQFPMTTP